MQFIFGDDTTRYTFLYIDDKPETAAKIKDLIRLPYSPSPHFDAFGFIPFGLNNSRTLFFMFRKDMKMHRNVYLLHGVYGESDKEYFFGNRYIEGIFTSFIDQDKFDLLRVQLLTGEKALSVPYSYDAIPAAIPYGQILIDPMVFREILAKLYQRSSVVLVMNDEMFTNDGVRLLIKKIFHYLTPSLRKICSYVTAVDSTGDMDFLLRIIPRSMMKIGDDVIDLNAPAESKFMNSEYWVIADYLVRMNDAERSKLFDTFEQLFYGKDAIYNKHNFRSFFQCYMALDGNQNDTSLYDKLLGDYLLDFRCPDEPEIPEFIKNALLPIYSSADYLDRLIDWQSVRLERIDEFYDRNIDTIQKVYYLCDKELNYFAKRLKDLYEKPYTSRDIESLKSLIDEMHNTIKKMPEPNKSEEQLVYIALDRCKYIMSVCQSYDEFMKKAKSLAGRYIQDNYENKLIDSIQDIIQYIISKMSADIDKIGAKITDIKCHFIESIHQECVVIHNETIRRKRQENRLQNEKRIKEETLERYKSVLYMGDILKSIDSDRTTNESVYVQESAYEPSAAELAAVAEDESLCYELAEAIANYLIQRSSTQGENDFVHPNPLLQKSEHRKITVLVAEHLCNSNYAELAVLYIAAYEKDLTVAMRLILRSKSVDEITDDKMTLINKTLPIILRNRSMSANLSTSLRDDLINLIKKQYKNKECSKQKKKICAMMLKSPILKKGENHNSQVEIGKQSVVNIRTILLISCLVTLVASLIALIILLVIVLKDDLTDKGTTNEGEQNTLSDPVNDTSMPEETQMPLYEGTTTPSVDEFVMTTISGSETDSEAIMAPDYGDETNNTAMRG